MQYNLCNKTVYVHLRLFVRSHPEEDHEHRAMNVPLHVGYSWTGRDTRRVQTAGSVPQIRVQAPL